MTIYIKENEIITELEKDMLKKNEETGLSVHQELINLGFKTVKVPDVEIPSDYKIEDFVKEDGVWKYNPIDKEVF